MRLRLRLLIYLLWARFRPRLTPEGVSIIPLYVLPNDVDLLHVTNDRYLAYMDLGRNDFAVRLGLLSVTRKLAAYPSVRFCCLRFRRAARLLSGLELRTRLLCWEESAAWFEQEFIVDGRSIALGYVCAEIRSGKSNVPIATLLEMTGYSGLQSPDVPEQVKRLRDQAECMRFRQQANEQLPSSAA